MVIQFGSLLILRWCSLLVREHIVLSRLEQSSNDVKVLQTGVRGCSMFSLQSLIGKEFSERESHFDAEA